MEDVKTGKIVRVEQPVTIDGGWDKAPWCDIEPLAIDLHMGEAPAHRPVTTARLAWDEEALYVVFRVEDRYVRAVAREHQQSVCHDSCVEFFFTPGPDISAGYFNIEMNCGGTMLFHCQPRPREGRTEVAAEHIAAMTVAHSMPEIVEPEVAGPVTWTVEYRLPFAVLAAYCDAIDVGPGAVWRANLYKCADRTSHPHWLTWAPVDRPKPDFHVPECFGRLRFV